VRNVGRFVRAILGFKHICVIVKSEN